MKEKIVAILSGGMDSTTLVYQLSFVGYDVACLSFDYGQRHVKELEAAKRTTKRLDLEHIIIPFGAEMRYLVSKSALTDAAQDIPAGHYAAENMKATVVPNRNMIMLALAAGYAITFGAKKLAYGAHAGDHTIYPDCRPEFAEAMAKALELCHFDGGIQLIAPFMNISKADICIIGRDIGVHFEDTWTCYAGLDKPCGVCGSCVERVEAFAYASILDPLLQEEK